MPGTKVKAVFPEFVACKRAQLGGLGWPSVNTKPQPIGTGCRFSQGVPLALPGAPGYGCQQGDKAGTMLLHLPGWCAVQSARSDGSQSAREPWGPRGYEVAHAGQGVQP